MPLFDQDAFDNSRYDAKDDIKDKELAVDMASDSAPPTTQNEAAPAGVSKVEGAQKIWTKKSRWALFIVLGIVSWVLSLDGVTTYQYLQYATSTVLQHSSLGTVSTANSIILSVGSPLMAKFADVFGRAETYLFVALLYAIGYTVIASANSIQQISGGEVVYTFGSTGLQMCQAIIVADVTTIRWRAFVYGIFSMPYVINMWFAAEIAVGILPDWRWGYGMFAIIVPACLTPIIGILLWSQNKAKKLAVARQTESPRRRGFWEATRQICSEMDFVGLFFVAAALGLLLLPLGLAPTASRGWNTPSMIAMIVIGVCLLPIVYVWETRFAVYPIMPARFFRNKDIIGACAIGCLDFISFYLQYTYQYSFVYVVQEWSARELSYFSNVQTLGLCIFGMLGGLLMAWTRSYKWILVGGLLIRLLGVGLMINARGALGPAVELVWCQLLQGIGGGIAAVATQSAAQASVSHADVATVTAMVLLITQIGNGIGTSVATAIWTSQMPTQLAKHVPGNNATLTAELFASTLNIATYAKDDPIRIGAIAAYGEVMKNLVVGATVVAIFPILIAIFVMSDFRLEETQNAIEDKMLDGSPTYDVELSAGVQCQTAATTNEKAQARLEI